MIKKQILQLIVVSLITAAVICPDLSAANPKAGTTAYSFLKVGTGAKSQALGGAFVGLADDETALYYNPAGLTAKGESYELYDDLLDKPEDLAAQNRFTASYLNYLLDFQYGFIGYIRNLDDRSAAGISAAYQNYGSFDRLNSSGDLIGTFGASDMALSLSYSRRVMPRLSLGASGKLIYQRIDEYSSDGLAADLGLMYLLQEDGSTRIGLALTNFGVQLSGLTESHKDPLPTKIALGMSHALRGLPLVFASEAGKPIDNDYYLAMGLEVITLKPFFLRVGWTTAGRDYKIGNDNDTIAGFAGGFGYSYKKYTMDYSYSSFADLGSVHRITLSGGF